MNIRELNERYGRHVLIGLSVLIWICIIWSFVVNGYLETWSLWHFPAKLPPFIDFRLIPSGAETFRSGLDPSISNPNDPMGHIFNYPKIWYIFFYTGITQADTIWICIVLIILFFLTVFSFPDKLFSIDALLVLMVVFSPACMLLYERGNVDLIFFVLCGLAIHLVSQYPAATVAVISIAAMFKFFPFFGVAIFLQENKRNFFKFIIPSTLIFVVYLALSVESIMSSWALTLRGKYLSYGVLVIFDILDRYIKYYLVRVITEEQAVVVIGKLPYVIVLFFATFFFLLGAQDKSGYAGIAEKNLIAFRMGAAIYVGTFLLGNNWDYRLAFLIFTVPQLSRWMFTLPLKRRWLVLGIFIVLLMSVWYTVIGDYFFLMHDGDEYDYEFRFYVMDEITNWTLFGGLTYLLAASAPEWFRTFARLSFRRREGQKNLE